MLFAGKDGDEWDGYVNVMKKVAEDFRGKVRKILYVSFSFYFFAVSFWVLRSIFSPFLSRTGSFHHYQHQLR